MTGLGVLWALFILGILVLAFRSAVRTTVQSPRTVAGWVYFIGTRDPADPIKIGYTTRNPRRDRLPEIETMSPTPLEVIYCFRANDAARAEAAIHAELKRFRQHGEWFDRDAALAYIDGLVY